MSRQVLLSLIFAALAGTCQAQPGEFGFLTITQESDFASVGQNTLLINVSGGFALEDKHIPKLLSATKLTGLTVSDCRLSAAGIKRLGEFGSLTRLEVKGEFKDTSVLDALGGCKNLTELAVDGLNGPPLDWIAALENAPKLSTLSIKGLKTSVGRFGECVGKLGSLSRLVIDVPCKFPDNGWAGLDGHRSLNCLQFRCCAPSIGMIKSMATLPKLVDLRISPDPYKVGDAVLDDAGITALAACTKLQRLDLDNAQITGKTFQTLKSCPDLTFISIWDCRQLTDLMFEGLPSFPKLADLQFNSCPGISDACVALLAESMTLKRLSLANMGGITMRTVGYLEACSNIQVTFDAGIGSRHPRKTMVPLYTCKNPASIVMESQISGLKPDVDALTVDGPVSLDGLKGLVAQRRLLFLQFSGATDDHLQQLGQYAGLVGCSLFNSPLVTDKGLIAIAGNKTLRELSVECSATVSDKAIEAFKKHPALCTLTLSPRNSDNTTAQASALTDAGLAALVAIPQLRRVCLTLGDGVTDAGIESLSKVKKLEYVRLSFGTKLTDQAAKALAGVKGLLHAIFWQVPGFTGGAARAFSGHKVLAELAFYHCEGVPREASQNFFTDNPGVILRGGKPADLRAPRK